MNTGGVRRCLFDAAVLGVLALLAAFSLGCAGSAPPKSTATGEPDGGLPPTPEQAPRDGTPAPSPTPEPGFRLNDGSLSYLTQRGEILTVPAIDGLVTNLVTRGSGDRAQYVAVSGNTYGLEGGSLAGEYEPNIDIYRDGRRQGLGGVSLVPQVARVLQRNAIAAQDPQSNKWIVALPVDISEMHGSLLISFEPNANTRTLGPKLTFAGTLPVLNLTVDGVFKFVKPSGIPYPYFLLDNFRNTLIPYQETIPNGREMHYVTMAGNFKGVYDQQLKPAKFGEQLVEVEERLQVFYSFPGGSLDVTGEKVLSVGESRVPVFVRLTPPPP